MIICIYYKEKNYFTNGSLGIPSYMNFKNSYAFQKIVIIHVHNRYDTCKRYYVIVCPIKHPHPYKHP